MTPNENLPGIVFSVAFFFRSLDKLLYMLFFFLVLACAQHIYLNQVQTSFPEYTWKHPSRESWFSPKEHARFPLFWWAFNPVYYDWQRLKLFVSYYGFWWLCYIQSERVVGEERTLRVEAVFDLLSWGWSAPVPYSQGLSLLWRDFWYCRRSYLYKCWKWAGSYWFYIITKNG